MCTCVRVRVCVCECRRRHTRSNLHPVSRWAEWFCTWEASFFCKLAASSLTLLKKTRFVLYRNDNAPVDANIKVLTWPKKKKHRRGHSGGEGGGITGAAAPSGCDRVNYTGSGRLFLFVFLAESEDRMTSTAVECTENDFKKCQVVLWTYWVMVE